MSFTIGIPVRNGEQFLAQAIESALAQTRTADEILVVDDGSSDGTRAIATDPKWQARVRYVYNDKPTGFADAFNRVANLAKSDIVVFLSADDLLDPAHLEAVEGGFSTFPDARFCYVGSRYIDANGKPMSSPVRQSSSAPQLYDGKMYVHNYLMGCLTGNEIHRCVGIAVQRELMVERCGFRKDAGIMADNDFFIRIASKTKVIGISSPLASVRSHVGAISSRIDSLGLRVAEDYLYQIRFLKSEPRYIAEKDMLVVYELAYRSMNSLLREAVLRGRRELGSAGLRLMQESMALVGEEIAGPLIKSNGRILGFIHRGGWAVALYRAAVFAAERLKKVKRMVLAAKTTSPAAPASAHL